MKCVLLGCILLNLWYSSLAQIADTLYVDTTFNIVCDTRGHVPSGVIIRTDMYCAPFIVDTDTATIMVYPACNYEMFTCTRCGQWVEQKERERRVVIWTRKQ